MTLQELIDMILEQGGSLQETLVLLSPNEHGQVEPDVWYDEEHDIAEIVHWNHQQTQNAKL